VPSEDKILYAFISGEVSEQFWGRSDLTKYDLGVAEAENFIVGFRGGLISRAGTRYIGPHQEDITAGKLFRFRGTATDTLLVFGNTTLRFIQNAAYVTETSRVITAATQASPGVFTCVSHGYSVGDLVYLDALTGMVEVNSQYYFIETVTTDTFTLKRGSGESLDTTDFTTYVSGGTVARVYTVSTPYATADVGNLDLFQRYNTIRVTHQNYPRKLLTYNADTDWTLVDIEVAPSLPAPTGVSASASSSGSAGVAFAVTAVDANEQESLLSDYVLLDSIVNYTSTAGSVLVQWTPVPGAIRYNIYRSLVLPTGGDISRGESLGYIGTAFGAQFTDNNIVPDFTKTPSSFFNPFADASITQIDIDASGTLYSKDDSLSVSDATGSGFDGYPIVDDDGAVIGISIVNGGEGYTAPTITVATSTGSGATLSATLSPVSGNNPSIFRVFQQRGIYFGSAVNPLTLWGSRPKLLDNYDFSSPTVASDGFSLILDSNTVKPIKHVLSLRKGLLVFTDEGIIQIGPGDTLPLGDAEPQVYSAIGDVSPIPVGLDVLYQAAEDRTVQALQYADYTETYRPVDLSLLAHHLLENHNIRRMEYVPYPNKNVLMPREDGRMLSLTYIRDQDVSGWSKLSTRGNFLDVCRITENGVSYVYVLVGRYLRGAWQQVLERFELRDDTRPENYWGVDCALSYPHTYPAAAINAPAGDGTYVYVDATAAVFSPDNVGDVLYFAGGKANVIGYTSPTRIIVSWERAATDYVPQTNALPVTAFSGEWSIVTPTTEVGNLWHLEGETVSVLADGDGFLDVVVTDGKITLERACTKIVVGLPYVCRASTLPLGLSNAITENRLKRIFAAFPRLYRSRGMSFGPSYDKLYEMQDRTSEDWGETLNLRSDVTAIMLEDDFSYSARLCVEQRWPLPAALLGVVVELGIG
jgi:hypothetical protein